MEGNSKEKVPMERSFLIVYKETLADKSISATEKLLLTQLADHRNKRTGQCNPRQATLAEELGMPLRTVERCLSGLSRRGLISIKRGQNGCFYEIPTRQNGGSHPPNRRFPTRQNGGPEAPVSLYEPYLNEPKGAAADAPREKPAAAAAAPPAGVSNPKPAADTPAQKLVLDLMPQHPEPGNLQRAVSEAGKLLAARPGAETAIRRHHELWRAHWASYPPGRFIPQLWRWLHDGDWEFPPAERKGALPETWAEIRQREAKESSDEYYLHLAKQGMWDALREYTSDVEKWREKVKALG